MGNNVDYNGFIPHFIKLKDIFNQRKECKFIINIKPITYELLEAVTDPLSLYRPNGNIHGNIYYSRGTLENVRGLITAGDLDYFHEALYAGVPLILIPFNIEQNFTTIIAKHMNVGYVIDHTKFIEQIKSAIFDLKM
uniref:Glucuronosyltransferase n=1 Tax=Meloidogyne hapla TaxID=6305 RepID=A0A1I8BMD8_MELHA